MLTTMIASSAEETSEIEAPNFRVFSNEKYIEPFVKSGHAKPPVVYVLVSIMSSLFTYATSVNHMMFETEQAYADAVIPIIYICADQLQRITESILHGEKSEKKIKKARENWRKQYQEVTTKLSTTSNHHVVYWEKLTSYPAYAAIRKFVNIILSAKMPTDTVLRAAFSDASSEVLTELLTDICSINVSPQIEKNAKNFKLKNERQLRKKRASDEAELRKQEDEHILREFHKKKTACDVTPGHQELEASGYEVLKLITLEPQSEIVKRVTYEYLAEEFAVFILLSHLNNAKELGSTLGLAASLPDQVVQPVLSYPISASSSAEDTFTAFAQVEKLYKKYAERLSLPAIAHPLTIVDSLIPELARPDHSKKVTNHSQGASEHSTTVSRAKKREAKDLSDSASDDSSVGTGSEIKPSEERNSPDSLDFSEPKTRSLPASPNQMNSLNGNNRPRSRSEGEFSSSPLSLLGFPGLSVISASRSQAVDIATSPMHAGRSASMTSSYFSHSVTVFGSGNASTDFPRTLPQSKIDEIVGKIITAIQQHHEGGLNSRTLEYKNGVTCEISIINFSSKTEVSALDDPIRAIIKVAVASALDGETDTITFRYKGQCFKLIAKPTVPILLSEQRINYRK